MHLMAEQLLLMLSRRRVSYKRHLFGGDGQRESDQQIRVCFIVCVSSAPA